MAGVLFGGWSSSLATPLGPRLSDSVGVASCLMWTNPPSAPSAPREGRPPARPVTRNPRRNVTMATSRNVHGNDVAVSHKEEAVKEYLRDASVSEVLYDLAREKEERERSEEDIVTRGVAVHQGSFNARAPGRVPTPFRKFTTPRTAWGADTGGVADLPDRVTLRASDYDKDTRDYIAQTLLEQDRFDEYQEFVRQSRAEGTRSRGSQMRAAAAKKNYRNAARNTAKERERPPWVPSTRVIHPTPPASQDPRNAWKMSKFSQKAKPRVSSIRNTTTNRRYDKPRMFSIEYDEYTSYPRNDDYNSYPRNDDYNSYPRNDDYNSYPRNDDYNSYHRNTYHKDRVNSRNIYSDNQLSRNAYDDHELRKDTYENRLESTYPYETYTGKGILRYPHESRLSKYGVRENLYHDGDLKTYDEVLREKNIKVDVNYDKPDGMVTVRVEKKSNLEDDFVDNFRTFKAF